MAMTSEEQSWLNNSISERTNNAHRRFMRGRANFIESNPAAVSSWERQSTLGRARELEDREGLRDHELAMLKKHGENDLEVAKQKAWGMQHQGESAAAENRQAAEASLKVEQERQRGLTEQERLRADRDRELRMIDGLNSLDLANTQGEWNLKAQQEATKAAQARAEAEASAKARAEAASIQKAQAAANGRTNAIREKAWLDIVKNAVVSGYQQGKSREAVLNELAIEFKNSDEMRAVLGRLGAILPDKDEDAEPGEGTTTTTIEPVGKWKNR